MISVPEKVSVNDFEYKVIVEFKQKKNSSAKVYGDKIILRVSNILPKKKQKEHISRLLASITKKIVQGGMKQSPFVFDVTKKFKIADKEYTTNIVYQQRRTCSLVLTEDNVFQIKLPDNLTPELQAHAVRKLVLAGIAKDNVDFLKKFVIDINRKYFNYKIKDIDFRLFKSKWGHCTEFKELSFNTFLLFCPVEIMEYIAIHELAHIEMMNHSTKYWQKVEQIMPDHKDKELWLKKNGNSILNMQVVF